MANKEGQTRKVVIIGGGFAGLNFVKRLDPRKFDITLVDRNNYHSFPPLFYQVASAVLTRRVSAFRFVENCGNYAVAAAAYGSIWDVCLP